MDDNIAAVDGDDTERFQYLPETSPFLFTKGVFQEDLSVPSGNGFELGGRKLNRFESGIPDPVHCKLDCLDLCFITRVHHQRSRNADVFFHIRSCPFGKPA